MLRELIVISIIGLCLIIELNNFESYALYNHSHSQILVNDSRG